MADGPIELYEWPDGKPVERGEAVALLQIPPAGHLPLIGDIVSIVLDSGIVRYRVLGRELVFNDLNTTVWSEYSKLWLYVREMPWDEQPTVIH